VSVQKPLFLSESLTATTHKTETEEEKPQATSICRLEWQWSEELSQGQGKETVTMETGFPKTPDRCSTLLKVLLPTDLSSHTHIQKGCVGSLIHHQTAQPP